MTDLYQIAPYLKGAKVGDLIQASRVMVVGYGNGIWSLQLLMSVSARMAEDTTQYATTDLVGECQQPQGVGYT